MLLWLLCPGRFLKRFAVFPAVLTNAVENGIFALQRKSVVFFDMLCDFIHKRTVQMQNTAAFHTFQMKMPFTVLLLLDILVSRLMPFLRNIFYHGSILL